MGQGYILVKSKVAFVKKVEAWAGSLMVLRGLKRWVVRKMEQSLHRVYRASKVRLPLPTEPWCAISESRGFAGLGRCCNSSDERKRGTTYGSRHATLACTH